MRGICPEADGEEAMGSISFAVGYNCLMRKQYQFAVRVNTVFAIGAKIVTDKHFAWVEQSGSSLVS